MATIASNIDRIMQIINTAYKYGRKVAVQGRSIENIVVTAHDIGYLGNDDFKRISERLAFVSVLITKLRDSLTSSPQKGLRWKTTTTDKLEQSSETTKPRNSGT